MGSFVTPVAASGGGTPGGSDMQVQYNSAGAFDGSANYTWNDSANKLTIKADPAQTGNLIDVQQDSGESYMYVNHLGNLHVGARDAVSSGGHTYRDSQRLYLDSYYDGTRVNNYFEAVPLNIGINAEYKMRLVTNNTTVAEWNSLSGTNFPLGWTTSNAVFQGSTLRSSNGSSILVRGEFQQSTVQGEYNTSGQPDVKIVGKNAFGGPTAGDVCGFFSDTTQVASITTQGYVKVAQGSLRVIGRTTSSADPTTTELPNSNDLGVHKNTTSGISYLALNDGGSIKKIAFT